MSVKERTGVRDLTYSSWHRQGSIRRYIPERAAYATPMIDIDACEYCIDCKQPLALIETQRSEHNPKGAQVTQQLATLAGIQAWSVSYHGDGDIEGFKVQQLAPVVGEVRVMSPHGYALFLFGLRDGHRCAGWIRRREMIMRKWGGG